MQTFGVEVGYLANGMGARIRAPGGHGHDPIAKQTLQCPSDLPLDRASMGLHLPSHEVGAVVLEIQPYVPSVSHSASQGIGVS